MRNTRNFREPAFGFTLYELIVSLAIAAILLAVAVPSYRGVVQDSRLSSQTNLLVTALKLARSEAIKRSVPVSVCASNNSTDCTASNWEDGWIVFTDSGTGGTVDGNDVILWVQQAFDSETSLSLSGTPYVQFQPNGGILSSCKGCFDGLGPDDGDSVGTLAGRVVLAMLGINDANAMARSRGRGGRGGSGSSGNTGGNSGSSSGTGNTGSGGSSGGSSNTSGSGSSSTSGSSGESSGSGTSGSSGNTDSGNSSGSSTSTTNSSAGSSSGGSSNRSIFGSAKPSVGTFTMCDRVRSGRTGRSISISATGRISISDVTCN